MRSIPYTALLILCARYAFATAQQPEILIYRGETNILYSTPLDSYFTTNNPKPEVWSQVEKFIVHTGCWRRYIGTWGIRDKALYLDALRFPEFPPVPIVEAGKTNTYLTPLPLLLPDKTLPLKADWFSGVIRLPKGNRLQYVHMGFGSIYERDHFIKIEKGRVVDEKIVDNLDNPKLYTPQADLEWQEIGKMTEGGGVVTDDPFTEQPDEGNVNAGDPFGPQAEQLDQGDWHDARMVRTTNFAHMVSSGEPFSTRGIFVQTPDALFGDEFGLFIPPTPLTQSDFLPFADVLTRPQVANGSPVEIKCKFQKTKKGYALHIISIRELKKTESIHRRDYRLPNKVINRGEE